MILILTILMGVILNISGVILGKYITLNFSNLYVLIYLSSAYIVTQAGRMIFWYLSGKKYQLSYLYPALSVNYIFAFTLGILLFGEQFEVNRLIGSLIIVVGVVIVTFSKSKHEVKR